MKDTSSTFLPHINGLRALAILGVIIYHLNSLYSPCGYYGVDVFLVISGFFLFRSLLNTSKPFSYGSYLLDKSWRLLPSWFIVTIPVIIISTFILSEARQNTVYETTISSAFFYSDYYLDIVAGDYFNNYAHQNPLLHFWYLSITEQLFILAPLLIVPLVRFKSRKAALITIGAISVASLVFYVLTTSTILLDRHKDYLESFVGMRNTYYHLISRLWEVGLGAFIAILPSSKNLILHKVIAFFALLALLASFYLEKTGSPNVYLSIICTILLIRYATEGWAFSVLSSAPLQWLGKISFSLYLWHWPVMVFWKYCRFDCPSVLDELGMLVLSLIPAFFSWKWIECLKSPSKGNFKQFCLRSSVLLTIPLLSGIACYLHIHDDKMPSYSWDSSYKEGKAYQEDAQIKRFENNYIRPVSIGNPEKTTSSPFFFLLGDSHALHLFEGLCMACEQEDVRGVFCGRILGTMLYIESSGSGKQQFPKINDSIYSYLRGHPELKYVVIAMYWKTRLYHPAGGVRLSEKTVYSHYTEEEYKEAVAQHFTALCTTLHKMGKKIILLGDVPTFSHKSPSPFDEWQRCQKLGIEYVGRTISQDTHEQEQQYARELIRKLENKQICTYIDVSPAMIENGVCRACTTEGFMYTDTNHLSKAGSRKVGPYLLKKLIEKATADGVNIKNEPALQNEQKRQMSPQN